MTDPRISYVPMEQMAESWQAIFRAGVCDHAIKELCRVYVSRTVNCEFCGNQRSAQASAQGLLEQQYDELLDFESSESYDEKQKAALAYTEAIALRLDTDDAFWERLHAHFSRPSWSSSAASWRSPTGSRAGSGCSTSGTCSTTSAASPASLRQWD